MLLSRTGCFYPVEKYPSRFTDVLITIIQEDYDRVKKEFYIICSDMNLVGLRDDAADFHDVTDVFILPFIGEGLNISIMGVMASSLSCLCRNIMGNIDLIEKQRIPLQSSICR